MAGVTGATNVVGVFGWPVAHSLSPAMHNAAFAALNLPYVYVPFPVAPENLETALRSLLALGIVGVNLTIPHKEAALPFLDEITDEARAVGAVNTVHCVDGRLLGDNTDGQGFMRPLERAGVDVRGQTVVVLGAGGAARSVAHCLARAGARVVLANRTRERAERLAWEIASVSSVSGSDAAHVIAWDATPASAQELGAAIRQARALVNTTRVGMHPDDGAMPSVPLDAFSPSLLVYDLVYNPLDTRLLQEARRRGCATLSGLEMLVFQGAAAFARWCGVWPPTDIMERAAREQLMSLARRAAL